MKLIPHALSQTCKMFHRLLNLQLKMVPNESRKLGNLRKLCSLVKNFDDKIRSLF